MSFEIVAVTDEKGAVVASELLVAAEAVHCQLIPFLNQKLLCRLRLAVHAHCLRLAFASFLI